MESVTIQNPFETFYFPKPPQSGSEKLFQKVNGPFDTCGLEKLSDLSVIKEAMRAGQIVRITARSGFYAGSASPSIEIQSIFVQNVAHA